MAKPHPALALAREARTANDPSIATPAKLFELCLKDGEVDKKMYLHAMTEAGRVTKDNGTPHDVCPFCKYDFSKPKAASGKVHEQQGGLF